MKVTGKAPKGIDLSKAEFWVEPAGGTFSIRINDSEIANGQMMGGK